MKAKVLCVYDEGAALDKPYIGARGLSLFVDVDGQRTLFDTGMSPRYLSHNLDFLEIKSDSLDRVVISHGHREHVGGIEGVLEGRTVPIDIFAPESAIGGKGLFRSHGLYIVPEFSDRVNMNIVEGWTELSENLHISSPIDGECFLVLLTKEGPVVMCGCSHCGVDKVTDAVCERFGRAPKGYIGGIHLQKKEKDKSMEVAEYFRKNNCSDLLLNHCTSPDSITWMRTVLGLKGVNNFYVGDMKEYEV